MAPKKLTGMEIFKLLPKTNCGECGVPTCMAFAMKLAQKNAELALCPYASDQAKEVIGAASEPPVRLVKFGTGSRIAEMGNEIVMFRHDKTFVRQPVFAFRIDSSWDTVKIASSADQVESYCLERVGEKLVIQSILINDTSSTIDEFIGAVKAVSEHFKGALIIKSKAVERILAASDAVIERIPLVCGITKKNLDTLLPVLMRKNLPSVLMASTLDEAYELADRCGEKGYRDIVLFIDATNAAAILQNNTVTRKAALSSSVKQMGYPVLNDVTGRNSVYELVADASTCVTKYASILVIDTLDKAALLPLMMLRQNIYTDPQKPIQVEPGIYKIGEAAASSPFMVTTNFSLTYFIVSGEVESSGVPVNLVIVETEGMSVLTAWAAGKFSGEKIASFLKEKDVNNSYTNRTIIIPGYVAGISGELEESLPGWQVLVGPQEASDIGPFMKRLK